MAKEGAVLVFSNIQFLRKSSSENVHSFKARVVKGKGISFQCRGKVLKLKDLTSRKGHANWQILIRILVLPPQETRGAYALLTLLAVHLKHAINLMLRQVCSNFLPA